MHTYAHEININKATGGFFWTAQVGDRIADNFLLLESYFLSDITDCLFGVGLMLPPTPLPPTPNVLRFQAHAITPSPFQLLKLYLCSEEELFSTIRKETGCLPSKTLGWVLFSRLLLN